MKKRYALGLAAITGIAGYLTGETIASSKAEEENIISHAPVSKTYGARGPESRTPTKRMTKDEAIVDLETKLASIESELAAERERNKPYRDVFDLVGKAASNIPLSALKGLKDNGGVTYLDRESGTLYFNAQDKIVTNTIGSSNLVMAVTGGQISAKEWNMWDSRGGKWKDGAVQAVGEDSYRAFVFGANGASVISVMNDKTGKIVGNTSVSGSIEDYGLTIAKNSEGKDVPLIWTLTLCNPLTSLKGDVQRQILGPDFSQFVTSMELYDGGKGRGSKDTDGKLTPYVQYAETLVLTQAIGDGITGGSVDMRQRINPQGDMIREGEPSMQEVSYNNRFGIKTGTLNVVYLQPKPGLTKWITPINQPGYDGGPGKVSSLEIQGDRVVYNIEMAEYPPQYGPFVQDSNIRSCNVKPSGEIYGLQAIVDSKPLATMDEEIERVDSEHNRKLREQGK
jgi:hypothetical protein